MMEGPERVEVQKATPQSVCERSRRQRETERDGGGGGVLEREIE